MKNFEMPKMNVTVFSSENIVTESGATTAVTKQQLAEAGLKAAEVNAVTVVNASEWLGA